MSDYENDRRAHRRYPMRLRLDYKLMEYGHICQTGFGETVNLSSHGLLCQVNEKLPDNRSIEVAVQWPYLLHGTCPLKLVVKGRIVRAKRSSIAIEAKSTEFRTAGRTAVAGSFQ